MADSASCRTLTNTDGQEAHSRRQHVNYESQRRVCRLSCQPIKCTNLTNKTRRQIAPTQRIVAKFFKLLIVNTILGHLDQLSYRATNNKQLPDDDDLVSRHSAAAFLPRVILADAIECKLDGDCGNREKICHENKCICARDRPIEDQDRCLPQALLSESCEVNEQCMGSSACIEGFCSCGNDAISLLNPSINIYYCHPKRQLGQECNFDPQCPTNSYCSTVKYGCVCQNGYKADTLSAAGCVPKTCTNSSTCESEFHQCHDGMCKCLATHFNPNSGTCYKFGSTNGKPVDEATGNNLTVPTSLFDTENNFYSTFKDLIRNSDNMWLVLIVLIALTVLLFVLIFTLIRKHYLGYCWTTHKNEYAPNNNSSPKNGNFNKNSINNKSFRKKNGELDDDDVEESAEDRSTLVPALNGKNLSRSPFLTQAVDKEQGYVKVNINEHQVSDPSAADNGAQFHHQLSPLASSTSTPV